jgi:transposase
MLTTRYQLFETILNCLVEYKTMEYLLSNQSVLLNLYQTNEFHFILETITMAHLMEIDPFDQPAGEQGKLLAIKNLSTMR